MQESVAHICLIGFSVIAAMLLVLRVLVHFSGARLRLARLGRLHRNECGSVQSLSFVLALPLFIMIMMGIVQASQIMVAQIVVEYAAIATARSASVWIPAHIADGTDEGRNRIGSLTLYDTPEGGTTYDVAIGGGQGQATYTSPKGFRIAMAAVQACLPIAPSRDTKQDPNQEGSEAYDSMVNAYAAMVPGSDNNNGVLTRLKKKLAYSLAHTQIQIRVFHPKGSNVEAPLQVLYDDTDQVDRIYAISHLPPEPRCSGSVRMPIPHAEFYDEVYEHPDNQIGWQDQITVTVRHDLALLPGPGRLLSKWVNAPDGSDDEISETIEQQGDVYTWPLTATATISNEGLKPVIRYEHETSGKPY